MRRGQNPQGPGGLYRRASLGETLLGRYPGSIGRGCSIVPGGLRGGGLNNASRDVPEADLYSAICAASCTDLFRRNGSLPGTVQGIRQDGAYF
jgi:hypothetical protein